MLPGRVALVLVRLRRGHVAFVGLALEDRDGRFARSVAEELARRKVPYATLTLDEIEIVFRNQQRRRAAPLKAASKPR